MVERGHSGGKVGGYGNQYLDSIEEISDEDLNKWVIQQQRSVIKNLRQQRANANALAKLDRALVWRAASKQDFNRIEVIYITD